MNFFCSFTLVFFSIFGICKSDIVCESQKAVILKSFKETNPITSFSFKNDSKTGIQVTWMGENTGKLMIVSTKEVRKIVSRVKNSSIYISNNGGKSFEEFKFQSNQNIIVKQQNGLQRNNFDSNNVFLVCYGYGPQTILFITTDGGITWKNSTLDFLLNQDISVHPLQTSWLLTLSNKNQLYQSLDGGLTWRKIMDKVIQYQWSNNSKNHKEIFVKVSMFKSTDSFFQNLLNIIVKKSKFILKKSSDNGATWKILLRKINGFVLRGKYFYVSELLLGNRRRLLISLDYGETFKRAYLPTIMRNQFFAILDIEDDMVFIHVDNPDDNGDGTLFTSDSDGRVFSQSLLNHFYPRANLPPDFYKVESMRGTYIATKLNPDKSMHSVITFNKGAEWKLIRKAENEPCHNNSPTSCYLQVSGKFSADNAVKTALPMSSKTAIGLIMLHGHLAVSLKRSDPDVYISSDGGYNWIKTLVGPHTYQIADHGGLLVAMGSNHQVLKFSTDEGRCWHEHQFTTDDIRITGILTEPGNKAMVVAVWGYHITNKQWIIHVLDLSRLMSRDCSISDYEPWYAHTEMMHPMGNQYAGCLLGKKEKFMRLKKDSLCRNGFSYELKKKEELCPCTEDDYECEYGYYRTVNSMKCKRNTLIKEDLCVNGVIDKIVTQGYKKIPADVCVGGFSPDKTKQTLINETCKEVNEKWKLMHPNDNQKQHVINSTHLVEKYSSSMGSASRVVGISIGIVVGLLVVAALMFILLTRTRVMHRRRTNLHRKILAGLRNRGNHHPGDDDDAALITNEIGYESTSPARNCKLVADDSDEEIIN